MTLHVRQSHHSSRARTVMWTPWGNMAPRQFPKQPSGSSEAKPAERSGVQRRKSYGELKHLNRM